MSQSSRRSFLKHIALAGSSILASPTLTSTLVCAQDNKSLGADSDKLSPHDRLNIAVIGVGNQGRANINILSGLGENIVALCDVDANQIANAQKNGDEGFKKARIYHDYRRLFDDAKTFDAVLIATPDHWHAPLCKAAMQAGKHVYCEKPLTRSVGEARELRELVKTSKVVTQMGNQGSASNSLRRSVELIKAGVLGQIHEVHAYVPGFKYSRGTDRPAGADPVPTNLNWDAWLGPAPARPYKVGIYHPRAWRSWYDFGSGQLGDFGCHTFNLPMRALALGYPEQIEVNGEGLGKESYFVSGRVQMHFAARNGLDPVTLIWHDNLLPPNDVFQDVIAVYRKVQSGVLLVGEKGSIFTNPWNMAGLIKLKGEDRLQDVLRHEATQHIPTTLPRIQSHQGEWVKACKGGPPTYSDFETGGHLTEIVLSGVLALRLGHDMTWDGEKMEVRDTPAAASIIHPAYRKIWLL